MLDRRVGPLAPVLFPLLFVSVVSCSPAHVSSTLDPPPRSSAEPVAQTLPPGSHRLTQADAITGADVGCDNVFEALDLEIARSRRLLWRKKSAPFFIGLEVIEIERVQIQGEEGGLRGYRPEKKRWIHADVRIGRATLDSSHPLRTSRWEFREAGEKLTTGEDVGTLRHQIWRETDLTYRRARQRFERVRADQLVLVEETQPSWDLAPVEPTWVLFPKASLSDLDIETLEGAIRDASAVFVNSLITLDPKVSLTAEAMTQWFRSTDGHRIRHAGRRFHLSVHADAIGDDGAELHLSHVVDTASPDRLPSSAELVLAAEALHDKLDVLRQAPREEPYSGPALLSGRAAAVFFHEIFGHRVEGHRLKEVSDGQTFRNRVGEAILPSFLSIHDDPTVTRIAGVDLRGSYRFDNQGSPAEPVTLVQDGVLRAFLESRSTVEATGRSNAHGRRQPGKQVVTRQGNLIVSTSRAVSEDVLRKELRRMAREAGLAYGLYVEDINGGFTYTGRKIPNAFNVTVNVARRVFVDGRPDQVVRGVDLIGTPLQTFSKIVASGDTTEVFNGSCGAESGLIPVSSAAPALLVSQIETQRKVLAQARPPLLPPPSLAPEPIASDVLLAVLIQNAERAATELQMPDAPAPSWVEMRGWDVESHRVVGAFGVTSHPTGERNRPVDVEVVVGDEDLNSSRLKSYHAPDARVRIKLIADDAVAGLSRDLWAATDESYKAAVKRYTLKSDRKTSSHHGPPDMVPVEPMIHIDPSPVEPLPREAFDTLAATISERLRGKGLLWGWTIVRAVEGRRYVVRSDGTRIREPHRYVVVYSYAAVVSKHGVKLEDQRQWVAERLEDLPSVQEMADETEAMGLVLQTRLSARKVPYYQGPVVFEGDAAAQLFIQLLPASLEGTPPPPEASKSFETLTRAGPRLKRRVLPRGWHIEDDPASTPPGFAGRFLYDEDGVRAEPVELVRNGLVVDMVMSRAPRRDVTWTNGRAREGAGRMTSWQVTAPAGLTDRGFERRVDRLRRDNDSHRVLVVRQLDTVNTGGVMAPSDAVWRYPDGREVPVLALEFQGVDRRTLHAIAGVGRRVQVKGYLGAITRAGSRRPNAELPMVITAPEKVVVTNLELVYPGASGGSPATSPPPMSAMHRE